VNKMTTGGGNLEMRWDGKGELRERRKEEGRAGGEKPKGEKKELCEPAITFSLSLGDKKIEQKLAKSEKSRARPVWAKTDVKKGKTGSTRTKNQGIIGALFKTDGGDAWGGKEMTRHSEGTEQERNLQKSHIKSYT